MAANVERMERSDISDLGRTLKGIGEQFIRYGLVVILLWVGALKLPLTKPKAYRDWSPTAR